MTFQINDQVVHPYHGLGEIEEIVTKSFPGVDERQYYEVAFPTTTVWVPVDSGSTGSLRLVTPSQELERYRAVLRSRPNRVNDDHRQRRGEINDQLKLGSFQVLCEIVRDLTFYGWRKPLRDLDAALLRRAREGLNQEWAAAEGVTLQEATEEIDVLLQEAHEAYPQEGM
jgi:RNA polymerase-interacting CarD/CdnL/TRCF family regulator